MIIIDIDGKVREEKYDGTIECIYKAGRFDTFDIVRLRHNVTMFVDDNGLLKPDAFRHINWKATYLRLNQWMENPQDISWQAARVSLPPCIVGDVVLLGADDDTGDTLELDDAQRELYLELLGEDVS
jgi:hypothetical protein